MFFNSIDFAIFLPIIFVLYWIVRENLKAQNILILIASYVFYAWWDWRFLSLILLSTIIDYFVGIGLSNQKIEIKRKLLLWISILFNFGLLGFFKYYNFFLDNVADLFTLFGKQIQTNTLHIILPVGISFYTFQTVSYSIDTYKRNIEPTKDFVSFAAFVSFFPQLVAGPIERAKNLLPQFFEKRKFQYNKAVNGLQQILWGLFKKVVIADNCAVFANEIFNHYDLHSGGTLLLGAIFFTFQIYGDFSGYSDIAIGTSRLLGFNLKKNFDFPYFSRDIAEFWRKWHISLSTWFRDYLYIPLGGSKVNLSRKVRNVFIIFIVSGFWHGANWTFIAWGAINALYFLPLLLKGQNRKHMSTLTTGSYFPKIKDFFKIFITFSLTVLAWIFFRAETLHQAISIIFEIFSSSFFTVSKFGSAGLPITTLLLIVVLLIVEWNSKDKEFGIESILSSRHYLIRWLFYSFIIFLIGLFMHTNETPFIYFQF